MRYRPVLIGVQITALLGLEEFRADRDRRAVPPEAAEQVRSARGFADPAIRRDLRRVALKIEAIAARRHRSVAQQALFGRVAAEMQI